MHGFRGSLATLGAVIRIDGEHSGPASARPTMISAVLTPMATPRRAAARRSSESRDHSIEQTNQILLEDGEPAAAWAPFDRSPNLFARRVCADHLPNEFAEVRQRGHHHFRCGFRLDVRPIGGSPSTWTVRRVDCCTAYHSLSNMVSSPGDDLLTPATKRFTDWTSNGDAPPLSPTAAEPLVPAGRPLVVARSMPDDAPVIRRCAAANSQWNSSSSPTADRVGCIPARSRALKDVQDNLILWR